MWRRYARIFHLDPETEVDEEVSFHLEMREREYIERGLTPEQARAAARERFGDVEAVRRECEGLTEARKRRAARRSWLAEVAQDARYGLRMMKRAPVLSVVVVVVLALGIGATASIFSLADAVLLRPLPYADPDRLVRIWEVRPHGDARNPVSPGNYLDWTARAKSFAAMGAYQMPYGVSLTGQGDPVRVRVAEVTPSALGALRASALRGRVFGDADSRADPRIAVISYDLWRTRFGADPAVLGRRIVLNDIPHTVMGVMPPDFDFPTARAQVWLPVTRDDLDPTERRSHNYQVVARLGSGTGLERAQEEMDALAATLAEEHPEFMQGWGVNVVPMHADLVAGVRPLILLLLIGVALLLLIACVDIANLLLARAVAREREVAVRGALGAGRMRLARQLVTETLLLALLGGALGVLVGSLMLRGLLALAPSDIPLLEQVRLDYRAVGFAACATLFSALVFGLVPAIRLARTDLQGTLRAGHDRIGGAPHARLRSALLVAEVAIALVLTAGAGLLVRSSLRLASVDYGFREDGLLAVSLDLPGARYDGTPAQSAFYRRLLERVRALPAVASAGATSEPPASGFNMTFSFVIEGRPSPNPSGREDPQPLRLVSDDYFSTMGIPLLEGRRFDARDRADAPPVVIVNRSLSRLHWPGESPVGRRISFDREGEKEWLEVVGVMGDTRMGSADEAPQPAMYIPYVQKRWDWASWQTLMVRAAAGREPASLAPVIRAAVWQLDARLAIDDIETVSELYRASTARRHFAMVLLVTFAAVALLLGTIGIYGVMSYSTAQRRQEIGIRVALGAGRGQVILGVLRHALGLAAAGVAIGIALTLVLSRALRAVLYEVSPTDPLTLAAVVALLLLVALAAAWLPARRATRVDPRVVLRG